MYKVVDITQVLRVEGLTEWSSCLFLFRHWLLGIHRLIIVFAICFWVNPLLSKAQVKRQVIWHVRERAAICKHIRLQSLVLWSRHRKTAGTNFSQVMQHLNRVSLLLSQTKNTVVQPGRKQEQRNCCSSRNKQHGVWINGISYKSSEVCFVYKIIPSKYKIWFFTITFRFLPPSEEYFSDFTTGRTHLKLLMLLLVQWNEWQWCEPLQTKQLQASCWTWSRFQSENYY